MNPEVKAKWVAALRSGEYQQGRGFLRTKDGFCCLGVLCNIHAQEHPEIAAAQNNPYMYMGEGHLPPWTVLDWAGFEYLDGRFGPHMVYNGILTQLPSLNDQGLDFPQIANLIEEQL